MKKLLLGLCVAAISVSSFGIEIKSTQVNIEEQKTTYVGVMLSTSEREYKIARDRNYGGFKGIDMWSHQRETIKAFDLCVSLGEDYTLLDRARIEFRSGDTTSDFAEIDFRMAPEIKNNLSFTNKGQMELGRKWISPILKTPLVRTGERKISQTAEEVVANVVCIRK